MFTNISQACDGKNCVLEKNLGVRVETFGHSIDKDSGDLTFYGLS